MATVDCAHCGVLSSGTVRLLRCTACHATYYCSREHQKAHWKTHKPACQQKKTAPAPGAGSKSAEDGEINIVEIAEGQGNGLNNKMRNLRFSSRREGMEHIQPGFLRATSPFASLAGWDIEIFWNPSGGKVLNAAGIFLTCELDTGLCPYPEVRGMIYVMAAQGSTRHLTSDVVWGLLNYIYDCMDYYGEAWSDSQIQARVQQSARRYRAQKWDPMGGSAGIPIYETDPNRCQIGPVVDYRRARGQSRIDREVEVFVAASMEGKRQQIHRDAESDAEIHYDRACLREFINSHAFPAEAAIQRFIAQSAASNPESPYFKFRGVQYRHDIAKQLYEAGAMQNEEDKMRRIRRLGHELHEFGRFDAMAIHFYVVHHVLCGKEFFRTNDYRHARLNYYSKIECLWDGVGTWRH